MNIDAICIDTGRNGKAIPGKNNISVSHSKLTSALYFSFFHSVYITSLILKYSYLTSVFRHSPNLSFIPVSPVVILLHNLKTCKK